MAAVGPSFFPPAFIHSLLQQPRIPSASARRHGIASSPSGSLLSSLGRRLLLRLRFLKEEEEEEDDNDTIMRRMFSWVVDSWRLFLGVQVMHSG